MVALATEKVQGVAFGEGVHFLLFFLIFFVRCAPCCREGVLKTLENEVQQ